MNKTLLGILVIILIIGAGVYIFSYQKKAPSPLISPSSVTPTSSQIPDISATPPSPMDLGAGGSSYLDTKGVFSILYPNDYILDTSDPIHIRIYKRGETQRPQSEMSDGALVVFETIDLNGTSLEAFVDSRINEATADGTSEIIESKKAIMHNSYPGFSYSIRGLGESNNLVLQKDKNSSSAVFITYSVSDPEGRGYQKEIDAALASIKLLK